MRGVTSLIALLPWIGLLAAAGCANSEAPATLAAAMDTVNGVPRLTYPEGTAPDLGWRLDTVAVIGGFDAAGDSYQFDQVRPGGVAGDGRGHVYVLDGAGRRVLGFDEAGRPMGAWGRDGNGPGELANPGGLAVAPDGTLWVTDDGNRRVTLIPTAGDLEPESIPLPEDAGALSGRIALTERGLYGVLMTFRFSPGDDSGPPPLPLVHMSLDGIYDDTLWVAERPHMDRVEAQAGNQVMLLLVQQAFAPGFFWGRFSDGTFAVAEGPEYEIHVLDPGGDPLRIVRRDPPARETTPQDMETERQRQRDRAPPGNIPGAEQMREKHLEALTFADRIPRITGLAIDAEDRLWVGVSVDTPGETERIDVYDREGALLGELPDRSGVPLAFYGADLAAELAVDELDVQQVVVYRLVEGAAGG